MLRSLAAWTLGAANTAAWGTLSLLGSLAGGSGGWAHACMVRWSRINLWLLGVRVAASGLEHVRRDQGQVFACNHQSMIDILVLAATLPVPFRFVAKRELFSVPFLGWHMRRAGFIPIDRENPRRAARTLLEATARIRSGVSAVVFPEGTRSRDGELLPFRGGGFLLAIRSGAPVVPVAISGTARILRKSDWRVHRSDVTVRVLEPVPAGLHGDDRAALAAEVRARIAGAVGA